MKTIYKIVFLSLLQNTTLFSQNYDALKIKEHYDFLNATLITYQTPCNTLANADESTFGDVMNAVLEGYITMYQTTKDKAYLYKFISQSLCIMRNRNDYSGDPPNSPIWSTLYYQNGYIIAALSRFVYLVKKEEPALLTIPLYQFSDINPNNNSFGVYYPTFGDYAEWLGNRVDETLNLYITNNFWADNIGFKKNLADKEGLAINQQVGYGRALLYMGFSDPNYSEYHSRVTKLITLIKGTVSFYDDCEDKYYGKKVFQNISSDNTYLWYHFGWAVPTRDCPGSFLSYYFADPSYYKYLSLIEDASHGIYDELLLRDLYTTNVSSLIDVDDMIRLRNTFTKKIYDGNGGFNGNVNGGDSYIANLSTVPHSHFKMDMLNYMPFEAFDGADATAVAPNVYDILMNLYVSDFDNEMNVGANGYVGLANKGHADVVQAQWKRECVNLSLYNRNVVYNQDFSVKNKLVVEPEFNAGTLLSYADPIINQPLFIVPSAVTVNMTAGETITLKPGVQIKEGSTFKASIIPGICTDGHRPSNSNKVANSNNTEDTTTLKLSKIIDDKDNTLAIYPNPFPNNTKIKMGIVSTSIVSLKIINNIGSVINTIVDAKEFSKGNYDFIFGDENLNSGIYYCQLIVDNQISKAIKLVKL